MSTQQQPAFCRSCGEPIMWLRSPTTGRLAPIECQTRPGGNVRMLDGDHAGEYAIVHPVERREAEAATGEEFHFNHFARCPNAKGHAKTKTATPATAAGKSRR